MFEPIGKKIISRTRDEVRNLILEQPAVKTFVVDGVSDLRHHAVDEWIENKSKEGKNRIQPYGAKDWGEINDIVRGILFPLINYCRFKDINLVLTCMLRDKYQDDKVVGSELSIKDWMAYNVDYIYWLKSNPSNEYMVECHKSPIGRGMKMLTGGVKLFGYPTPEEVGVVPLGKDGAPIGKQEME